MRAFLCVLACLISCTCWSQPDDEVLDIRMSIAVEEVSLGKVLDQLEQKAAVSFAYNSRILPLKKKVSLDLTQQSLREILDQLFSENDIGYQVIGRQVLLFRKDDKGMGDRSGDEWLNQSPARDLPKHTFSGWVRDSDGKMPLVGVNIFIPELEGGATTDARGFFSLTLPRNIYTLRFSFIGYNPVELKVDLDHNIRLDVVMEGGENALSEVIVEEEEETLVQEVQMSKLDVPMQQVREIPTLLGEQDVFRVFQLLPGVQGGREGQGGLFVRGGQPEQNLILLDGIPLYRPQHLLGAFSAFNGDALKQVSLLKGGFPARYGGRLSSVMDLQLKEANKERITGNYNIGLISMGGMLEAPLQKDRTSILLSGRRFFWDLLLSPLLDATLEEGDNAGYSFHDLYAKLDHEIDDNNRISASFYWGADGVRQRSQTNFVIPFNDTLRQTFRDSRTRISWGNYGVSLRWTGLINDRLAFTQTAAYSSYKFQVFTGEENITNGVERVSREDFRNRVEDLSLSSDWSYYGPEEQKVRFGLNLRGYGFSPQLRESSFNDELLPVPNQLGRMRSLESSLYGEYDRRFGQRWQFNAGLRLVHYWFRKYSSINVEPRLSVAWRAGEFSSFKFSYALTRQNMHLVGHSGLKLPTDLWLPAGLEQPSSFAHQLALGMAREFPSSMWELQVEGYYKRMGQIVNLQPGSDYLALFIDGLENYSAVQALTSGNGYSTGLEFLLRKKSGRLTGWLSYTLSWTRARFPQINGGDPFWMDHDRRHDVSVVGIYQLSNRWKLSGSWTYGSGSPYTLPGGAVRYLVNGPNGSYYRRVLLNEGKNNLRGRAYHRLDVSLERTRVKGNTERTWVFGLYNAYARPNPFIYDLQTFGNSEGGDVSQLVEIRLLPILPSISYRVKFL